MSVEEIIDAYRKGDYDNSWRELASIELSTLNNGDYEQVVTLVRDVIEVVANNIATLIERLKSSGFKFKYGNDVVVASNDETRLQLEEVEARIGKVPLVLKCFYERFHRVDFAQHSQQMVDSKARFYLFQMYITLIVAPPSHALERWDHTNALSRDPEYLQYFGRTEPFPVERVVETGPVLSSGEPVGFYVPSDLVDSQYYEHLVTRKPVLFLEQMRKGIRFAGFGNFAGLDEGDPHRVLATEISNGVQPF